MKIPEPVVKIAAKQLLTLKKNAPHILFGAGVAGVITSTVLACRATLRLEEKLDKTKIRLDDIKRDELQPYLSHRHTPKHDTRREIAVTYVSCGYEIAKLYGPSVIIGAASIGALIGSHSTLTKRNNAITAAYVTLSKAFQDYRDKVREELGEQRELELYRKSQVDVVQTPDGTKTIVSKDDREQYARVFDDRNRCWEPNAESNYCFLKGTQEAFNTELRVKKHVILNDVYKALGFEATKAGCVVGWVYEGANGDGYIDFGLDGLGLADYAINGDRTVLLDFNVDGIIYHLI